MPVQRKLPGLLKALITSERASFLLFLRSPFFNSNESYCIFFKRLCERYPQTFGQDDYDWEAVYKKAFPKRDFNTHKLDTLLPALARLLELFFAVKEAFLGSVPEDKRAYPKTKESSNYSLPAGLLAERQLRNFQSLAFGKRNMFHLFQDETDWMINSLNSEPVKDTVDYLTLHQLHHRLYFHPDTFKFNTGASNLESAMVNLDFYYFLNKLHYIAEMKTRERIFDVQHQVQLMDEIMERTSDPGLLETHPLIAIYHKLVQLYYAGINEAAYQELMEMFLEKLQYFSQAEQRMLMQHLINYGIFINEQHGQVEAALLALYKKGMETGILVNDDRLTDGAFTNIVFTAALCGDYSWAETFIHKFAPRLENSKRLNAVALAESCLWYARGELDKAHSRLLDVDITIPSYDIRAKGLLLKIAFDSYVKKGKDYEYLVSYLASYEKYVQSRPLWGEKKLAFLNLIKFIRKLAKLKFVKVQVSQNQKHDLLKTLERLQPLISKNWLVQKIEEM